jgi:hypothetical protein
VVSFKERSGVEKRLPGKAGVEAENARDEEEGGVLAAEKSVKSQFSDELP